MYANENHRLGMAYWKAFERLGECYNKMKGEGKITPKLQRAFDRKLNVAYRKYYVNMVKWDKAK